MTPTPSSTDLYRSGPGGVIYAPTATHLRFGLGGGNTYYRADGLEVADAGDQAAEPTGLGVIGVEFARFDSWNAIDSTFEGRFLERYLPGSFIDSIEDRGDRIKVLYDHGHDPSIGNKVLGRHTGLRETSTGPVAEVELFDTSYNRDLAAGLAAGAYGASFRFRVAEESWNDDPEASEQNPEGLPERTIGRVELFEFGPVTFPADESTSVGMRSTTDRYLSQPLPVEDLESSGEADETDTEPRSGPGRSNTNKSTRDIAIALARANRKA